MAILNFFDEINQKKNKLEVIDENIKFAGYGKYTSTKTIAIASKRSWLNFPV